MSGEEVEKSIKVVVFDGKQSSWIVWEEKFIARAIKKGYFMIFLAEDDAIYIPKLGEDNLYTTTVNSDGDEVLKPVFKDKDIKNWLEWNIQAYSDLVMCMDTSTPTGRVAFDIVRSSKTEEYPFGNARVAMHRLKAKYTATTSFALSTIYRKYAVAKLRQGQDPDTYITYLQDLRSQMADLDHKYSDHQFMMHVLSGLGDDYEYVVYNLDHRLMADPPTLTIDSLRDE
jgi:gag-polypeptide of LTR copia-type